MDLQAVLCRARDLLLAQGMQQSCQYLTEDEATRFLLANKLNVSRSAEALAKRAKFKTKFQLDTPVRPELKLAFPMHWINDLVLRITPQKHLPTIDSLREQDIIDFIYYIGEAVAMWCDTHQYQRISIEVWFADDFVQDTRLVDALLGIAARHFQSQHPERIKSISLVNFPTFLHPNLQVQIKRLLPAEMLRLVQYCDADADDNKQNVGELIYEVDFTKEKSTESLADDDEIAALFVMLQTSLQRAQQVEMINLEANARMRAKLARSAQEEDVSSELRQQLVNETAEVEALKRAVAFARNFMDLEERERRDFQAEMEATITTKQEENRALLETLQATFGNDAEELLKQ